jgi:hypothetical protein
MEDLYFFIHYWTEPLYSVIYRNYFFFIDYWSFIHLTSGALLMLFAQQKNWRRSFLFTLSILLLWETIEASFVYFSVNIFNPEILSDQATDIIIGMTGAVIPSILLPYNLETSLKTIVLQKQKEY